MIYFKWLGGVDFSCAHVLDIGCFMIAWKLLGVGVYYELQMVSFLFKFTLYYFVSM